MKRILLLCLAVLLLTGCAPQIQPSAEPSAPVETQAAETDATAAQAQETQMPLTLALPEEVTLEKVGQTMTLFEGRGEDVLWNSENEQVAAVENGVLTALERGETTVTAKLGEQTQSCHVICDLPVPLRRNEEAEERDPVYLPPDVEIVDDSFFADAVFIGDSQGLLFYNCTKYYSWFWMDSSRI